MPLVYVRHLVSGRAEFSFPFNQQGVDVMRGLPLMDRDWVPERRCWRVYTAASTAQGIATFRALGWEVIETSEAQDEENRRARERERQERANFNARDAGRNRARGPTLNGAEDAFRAVFDLVPYDRRDALFKALVRVFHPDVGGSEEHMKALNKVAGR